MLGDLLGTLLEDTLVHGRLELGAPWGVQLPDHEAAYLVVVARGQARLEVDAVRDPFTLSAGDLVLLPHGGAHRLRDSEGSPVTVLGVADCRRAQRHGAVQLGSCGTRTTLIVAAVRFRPAHRSLSLQRLSPVIHLPAGDPSVSPGLTSMLSLLVAESAAERPGATVVMNRLVDILLVEAVRAQIAVDGCPEHGLRALSDKQIGHALTLIHQRPEHAWTVELLAAAAALSRSAFAARFTALVGVAPADYLTRWRMTKAAELLRAGELSTSEIAARSGYRSEASFNRAFKRTVGTPPGRYRRDARRRAAG